MGFVNSGIEHAKTDLRKVFGATAEAAYCPYASTRKLTLREDDLESTSDEHGCDY